MVYKSTQSRYPSRRVHFGEIKGTLFYFRKQWSEVYDPFIQEKAERGRAEGSTCDPFPSKGRSLVNAGVYLRGTRGSAQVYVYPF